MARPHEEETPIEELEIHELLAKAIPRGESDNIGRLCGCSGQTVRKWRNDPDTDENREADPHGRYSPLDNFIRFLNAVHARNPKGAEMIKARVDYEFADMAGIHGNKKPMQLWQAVKKAHSLALELVAATDLNGDNADG